MGSAGRFGARARGSPPGILAFAPKRAAGVASPIVWKNFLRFIWICLWAGIGTAFRFSPASSSIFDRPVLEVAVQPVLDQAIDIKKLEAEVDVRILAHER